MVKKLIPVAKTSYEEMEIEFPLYSYYEDVMDEGTYGIYVRIDENLKATLFITECRGKETFYKVKIIKHHCPNELEIANRITEEQFLDGAMPVVMEIAFEKMIRFLNQPQKVKDAK